MSAASWKQGYWADTFCGHMNSSPLLPLTFVETDSVEAEVENDTLFLFVLFLITIVEGVDLKKKSVPPRSSGDSS